MLITFPKYTRYVTKEDHYRRVPKVTKTPLPKTFDLFFASIKRMYQTFKTVFDHISKPLEVRQKYSAVRRIFNSLLGVWKCGQTRFFVFDISHQH